MTTATAQKNSPPRKLQSERKVIEKATINDFALEQELVLLCSRTELKSEQINRVSFIISLMPDWDYVLGISYRNGVLPLVSKNLLNNFVLSIDSETKNKIGEFYNEHTLQNIYITGKLIEVIKMLDSAGIPSLPFKGPTLAMQIYKNLSLRQFVDLDLLVQPKHFDASVKLFLENGFQTYAETDLKKSNALFINRKKDIGLVSEDEKVRIELHWKLSGSFFALPFELKELWNRLEKTNLGGCEINALPFNDLFVYLCLHGARHGFERLGWICDLCELIKSEKEIDWQSVRDHAKNHGCGKTVELGLLLAYELFGIKTSYPDWEQIEQDEILKKIVARIRKKIFTKEFNSTEIGDWYLYHLMLKEKKTDQIKLHLHYIFWYLKLALKPNTVDRSIFHLPPVFYPLYYILRPTRLLLNYLSGKNSKDKPSL